MDQKIQRLKAIMLMMRDLQVSADLKLREHGGQRKTPSAAACSRVPVSGSRRSHQGGRCSTAEADQGAEEGIEGPPKASVIAPLNGPHVSLKKR